jgi:hypothetical protein
MFEFSVSKDMEEKKDLIREVAVGKVAAHSSRTLIPSPHLLVLTTIERRVPTVLSLAKIALKVPLAGRNRSLVTNRCGEGISIKELKISVEEGRVVTTHNTTKHQTPYLV